MKTISPPSSHTLLNDACPIALTTLLCSPYLLSFLWDLESKLTLDLSMKSRGDATQKRFLPCKHPEEIRIFHVAGDACLFQIWGEEGAYLWQIVLCAGDLPKLSGTLPWNSPTEGSRATPWSRLDHMGRRMKLSHEGYFW